MTDSKTANMDIASLYGNTVFVFLVWTAILAASFAWNYVHESNQIVELARKEAFTAFQKDIAFRQWGTKHGGVYVD